MLPVRLRSFRKKVEIYGRSFKRFLTKLEKNQPPKLDVLAVQLNAEIWAETDCLTCANCCKTMTPTYSTKDITRIAGFLGIRRKEMKEKWLTYDKKAAEWTNKTEPCQFLDLNTNKCSIYPVRPADCAGFPHLTKKRMIDYIHIHKQNLSHCPATFKLVEKMKERIDLINPGPWK